MWYVTTIVSFVLHGGWLTTKEVADLLRVHPKHVYRLLKQGLPARQVGGHWRFSPAEVREWMARGRPVTTTRSRNKRSQIETTLELPALVAGGADLVIDTLVRQVNAARPIVGVIQTDTATALDWLTADHLLAVGVLGDCIAPAGAELARLHVAYEHFGLAAAPGHLVPPLQQIAARSHRLVSWTEGSDLRSQLDGVLRREGVDPRRAHAGAALVDGHGDAVSALLCGGATVGLTTAAWARRAALPFVPLGSRPLSLVVKASSLGHPALIRCWHAMQSVGFADALAELGDIELTDAGRIHYLAGEDTLAKAGEAVAPSRAAPGAGWVFMLRSRGAASDKPLGKLAAALQARGLRCAGFVQTPRRRRGEVTAYELRRLSSSERLVLARRSRPRNATERLGRSFQFIPEAFSTARGWLEQDGPRAAVLILDGIGTLEATGRGHHDALVWAARRPSSQVVVAALRRDQAATISQRLGLASRQLATIETTATEAERELLVEAIANRVRPSDERHRAGQPAP